MKTQLRVWMHNDVMPVMAAMVFVLFLFWADEGKYNMDWVSTAGGWIMFLLYTGGLVLGEMIVSNIISDRYHGWKKTGIVVGVGIPFGVALAVIGVRLIAALIQMLV